MKQIEELRQQGPRGPEALELEIARLRSRPAASAAGAVSPSIPAAGSAAGDSTAVAGAGFCTQCGTAARVGDRFCSGCGSALRTA